MSDLSTVRLRLSLFVVAIWMGALWAACVLVPSVSFTVLADASLAGRVAGRSFWIASIVGAVCGAASITLAYPVQTRRWLMLAVLCAALPIVSEAFVGPAMRAARAMGDAEAVRTYHGIASALFMSAAILSIVLFWMQTRVLANLRAG